MPARALENPRQVSAYDYPRQYGPAAPSFSRAMLTPDPLLLVSGTASIVGHASVHPGDVAAQLEETLANLDSLLRHARARTGFGSAQLGPASLVKVYLRSAARCRCRSRARLRERLGQDVPFLILAADICRSELLLEIEVVQRGGAGTQRLSAASSCARGNLPTSLRGRRGTSTSGRGRKAGSTACASFSSTAASVIPSATTSAASRRTAVVVGNVGLKYHGIDNTGNRRQASRQVRERRSLAGHLDHVRVAASHGERAVGDGSRGHPATSWRR